jgi:formylglycine-generating enzyme required for sulfatase activity
MNSAWHPLTAGGLPTWGCEWAQDRYGVYIVFEIEGVPQRMRWIPPGRFRMGSPESESGDLPKRDYERDWFERERPQHEVILSQGVWLADTPCTQALWAAVMGGNPSRFQDPGRPVEQVGWDDVQEFLEKTRRLRPDLGLVLPTEAQWEYACRAGTQTATYAGDLEIRGERDAPVLDAIAWYGGNSGVDYDLEEGYDSSDWPETQYPHRKTGTRRVGLKRPNPCGLYDMLGNVWEWCRDGPRAYGAEAVTDPVGPVEAGAGRVVRGGSWDVGARRVRAAYRLRSAPVDRRADLGFRCARAQA